jgi:hypothetical protein
LVHPEHGTSLLILRRLEKAFLLHCTALEK